MGGGGKGGGGGGGSGDNAYTRALGRIANTTFDESTPLRRSITHSIGNIFGITGGQGAAITDGGGGSTGVPVPGQPVPGAPDVKWTQAGVNNGTPGNNQYWDAVLSAPTIPGLFGATPQERAAIEAQYNIARGNALNSGARGSTLARGLGEVDIARAGHVSNLVGAEKQRALSTALGVAYNTPQQAQSGLSAAASQSTAQAQLEAQRAAQQSAGFGSFLGGKK